MPATETPGYTRVCLLSSGGMGEVEVAIRRGEDSFERLYAIKRPHDRYHDDAAYLTMFKREGRIAGLIRHPNVVSVLDVGTDDRGPYLVMDYVEGVPVSALMNSVGSDVPMQVGLRIARGAARGLQAAHELQDHEGERVRIIHRDVSPQNILLGFDGSVRVTDFGIAKPLDEAGQTDTGVVKGKLGYLAPELLRFEDADQRADLFALGVVLYEVLTGQRLYKGEKVPWRILHEEAPDLCDGRPDFLPEVGDLVRRLLAKEPKERFQTARDVVRALDEMIAKLAAADGVITLDEYARDVFGQAREEHGRWLSTELARLHEHTSTGVDVLGDVPALDAEAPAIEAEQTVVEAYSETPPTAIAEVAKEIAQAPQERGRRRLMLGSLVAVLGMGLALLFWYGNSNDTGVTTDATPAESAPAVSTATEPIEPSAEEPDPRPPVDMEGSVSEDTTEVARPRMRERPRMRPNMRARMVERSAVTPLGWDEN